MKRGLIAIGLAALIGLSGCMSGRENTVPDTNTKSTVTTKSGTVKQESSIPPSVTRILPDEINSKNAHSKASELGRELAAEQDALRTASK